MIDKNNPLYLDIINEKRENEGDDEIGKFIYYDDRLIDAIHRILLNKNRSLDAKIKQHIRREFPDSYHEERYVNIIKSHIMENISKRTPISYDFTHDHVLRPYQGVFSDNDLGVLYNWIVTSVTIPLFHSLGDTIGYHDGKWEFNYGTGDMSPEYVNTMIYEYIELGGIVDMSIKNWKSSDDTIMYLATMKSLAYINKMEDNSNLPELLQKNYLGIKDMLDNRHPGVATMNSLNTQKIISWNQLPYDSKVIGAGSAMRSGFIGVVFQNNDHVSVSNLVRASVVSSLITHTSTTAILGSIVAALFTSFSIQKIAVNKWPHKLLKLIRSDIIDNIFKELRPDEYKYYQRDRIVYIGQWEKYIKLFFNGVDVRTDLKFMRNPVERYRYLAENFSKGCNIPGSCGDDCLIMAYDSILRCNGSIEKLLVYSILHPGDSDTIGSIAFGWFCGYYNSPRVESIVAPMLDKLEFKNYFDNYQLWYMFYLTEYYFDVIAVSVMKSSIRKLKKS